MIISVVIPVVRRDLFLQLWEDLKRQSMAISQAVIVDNAQCLDANELQSPFLVQLLTPARNIGVNPAWNIGFRLSMECDVVAVLNDDIRIGRQFMPKAVLALGAHPEAGVVCPLTEPTFKAEDLNTNVPQSNHSIAHMTKREGWAMVIDGDLIRQMPPIPETLRTFCGDDWIWYWSHRLGRRWIKDMSNVIYHQVGASMAENPQIRETLRAEKAEFPRIIRALEAN